MAFVGLVGQKQAKNSTNRNSMSTAAKSSFVNTPYQRSPGAYGRLQVLSRRARNDRQSALMAQTQAPGVSAFPELNAAKIKTQIAPFSPKIEERGPRIMKLVAKKSSDLFNNKLLKKELEKSYDKEEDNKPIFGPLSRNYYYNSATKSKEQKKKYRM